jgi:hypothetical protein
MSYSGERVVLGIQHLSCLCFHSKDRGEKQLEAFASILIGENAWFVFPHFSLFAARMKKRLSR